MSFRGGAAGGAGEELSEEFGETVQDQEVNTARQRKVGLVKVGLRARGEARISAQSAGAICGLTASFSSSCLMSIIPLRCLKSVDGNL